MVKLQSSLVPSRFKLNKVLSTLKLIESPVFKPTSVDTVLIGGVTLTPTTPTLANEVLLITVPFLKNGYSKICSNRNKCSSFDLNRNLINPILFSRKLR